MNNDWSRSSGCEEHGDEDGAADGGTEILCRFGVAENCHGR